MKKDLKLVCKMTSNILLYLASLVLVAALWIDNNILGVSVIAFSVIAIFLYVLGLDKIKNAFTEEINIYYFIVLIVLGYSKINDNQNLFRIGIALLVLVILVYAFFIFIKREDTKVKNEVKKSVKNKK